MFCIHVFGHILWKMINYINRDWVLWILASLFHQFSFSAESTHCGPFSFPCVLIWWLVTTSLFYLPPFPLCSHFRFSSSIINTNGSHFVAFPNLCLVISFSIFFSFCLPSFHCSFRKKKSLSTAAGFRMIHVIFTLYMHLTFLRPYITFLILYFQAYTKVLQGMFIFVFSVS